MLKQNNIMNKIITIVILCLLSVHLNAQIRFESTVNTTGSYAAAGSLQLEWSMGEQLSIQQFNAGALMITTGILQGSLVKITDPTVSAEIKLFPNPANSFFNASLQFAKNGKIHLQIFDMSGKKVSAFSKDYVAGIYLEKFTTEQLAAGTYIVQVLFIADTGESQKGSYKMIIQH
jgi:hypothetical protein